ncbi:MAG: hypothetical protein M3070_05755 [Actinomycetota bacterium]|nr:hypothetical protein [Actinomycetota bacterium]
MEPAVFTPVSAVANLRRSAMLSVALGAVSIVALAIAGHPLMGVLGTLGLALGAVNNWMLQKSVLAYGASGTSKKRFRGGVFGRLGVITLVAIAVALLFRPDGLAIFVGLAVFHVLMLVGAALPVFRSLRPSS